MVRNRLEPYESRGSRTVLRGGGPRKGSSLPDHPGDSADPSGTDEDTFERCFGQCDWSVMAIVAQGGETFARLRFGVGPGGDVLIPVQVDYTTPFAAGDKRARQTWEDEYTANVHPVREMWNTAMEGLGILDDDALLEAFGMDDADIAELSALES